MNIQNRRLVFSLAKYGTDMSSNLNSSPTHTHSTAPTVRTCILPHPLPTQWKCLPTFCRQVLGKCNPPPNFQRAHG